MQSALKENPDALSTLFSKYRLPFEVVESEEEGERPFLNCRDNLVGDKNRSPWTNKLHPITEGGSPVEDTELRVFELKFNEVWDAYKNLYYGHEAVGSVFLSESETAGFTGVFCVQKKCSAGTWDSIHLVSAVEAEDRKTCTYRVQSSALLFLTPSDDEQTTLDVSASLSKETIKEYKIMATHLGSSHIENLGELIEANEIDLRSSLERVHIPKTQEIMDDIKKAELKMPTQVNPLMGMIMGSDVLKKKKLSDS